MLAGINERTFAGVFKRCRAAAALPSTLDELYRQPGLDRRSRSRQPSQTTTDNDYPRR